MTTFRMDFGPLEAELSQRSPDRAIVIEELDAFTDPLRAGCPTTEVMDRLLDLFTRLIKFPQWHIQQDTLSCTKYIFMNSTLSKEEKKEILLKHVEFTEEIGLLLNNKKREVREMAAQCIGQLAIQLGSCIIDDEFKLNVFRPLVDARSIEGHQMALGRLATAFRIVAPESLKVLLPHIMDTELLDKITIPSDNGYVYWYSTRALLLFINSKLDAVLAQHLDAFTASHKLVLESFKEDIMKCALSRLNHQYIQTRRTAALVIAELYKTLSEGREEFIQSLLPTDEPKWIQREGRLLAVDACISATTTPLKTEYVEELCKALVAHTRDTMDMDKAPLAQKGNANGCAGRALVHILIKHDASLFEKYVHDNTVFLLDAAVAPRIDAGDECIHELQKIGGFPLDDLYVRGFKNIFHASFPIRDLARRIIPSEMIIEKYFDELMNVLVGYGSSVDSEVRESVCKAFQAITKTKPLSDAAIELAIKLVGDNNETVITAALDALKLSINETNVARMPEIAKSIIIGDGDDSLNAAIGLLKASLVQYKDVVFEEANSLSPVLAFHAITAMSPAVATSAQQVIVLMAGDKTEIDADLKEQFAAIDVDGAGADEYDEVIEACAGNDKAAATMIEILSQRFLEDLGVDSVEDAIEGMNDDMDMGELLEYVMSGDKAELVNKLSLVMIKSAELSEEQMKKMLQVLADAFVDESIDFDEKKALFFALDIMRKNVSVVIPDPTPVSTTHLQEGFSKTQSI